MREKEILGFKREDYFEKNDSICPNCGNSLNIPILAVREGWFKVESWDEYTCSECGLQWRIKN